MYLLPTRDAGPRRQAQSAPPGASTPERHHIVLRSAGPAPTHPMRRLNPDSIQAPCENRLPPPPGLPVRSLARNAPAATRDLTRGPAGTPWLRLRAAPGAAGPVRDRSGPPPNAAQAAALVRT